MEKEPRYRGLRTGGMNMKFPVSVSVVMATYNTEISMLREAVESILNQTFHDFEFLIVDDGSTNDSGDYLRSIQDKRVRIIWNVQNMGVTKSLNVGLKQAKGRYIARMDADDVSFPTRLEKQFSYMEAHQDVIVYGMRNTAMDKARVILPFQIKTDEMAEYRVRMLFTNPGPIHPSAMIRHETLLANHILYDENLVYAQDYGLWETLSHYGKIHLTDDKLVNRRKHSGQISIAKRNVQIQCDKMTQKKMLSALLGDVTEAEVDLHYTNCSGTDPNAVITPEISEWLDRLSWTNKSRGIYDQKILEKRIITIRKNLIRQSFDPNMSEIEKVRLVFRFLPFLSGVRMVAGMLKSTVKTHNR